MYLSQPCVDKRGLTAPYCKMPVGGVKKEEIDTSETKAQIAGRHRSARVSDFLTCGMTNHVGPSVSSSFVWAIWWRLIIAEFSNRVRLPAPGHSV